jgi:UDP-N-acetylmuramoyl-tripeptide--D-alanyl-D-alanine ligase
VSIRIILRMLKKIKKYAGGFSVKEILLATSGTLLQGNPDARIRGISIDTRTIKLGDAFLAIKGNNFDGHDFVSAAVKRSAAALIISKKKSVSFPKDLPVVLVKDTNKALGDIARFHRRRFKIPVVAITGSNGKTTTKEMAAALLKVRFPVLKNEGTKNNHIGVPLTLLKLNPRHRTAVLEFGTNHPGEVGYLAGIALPTVAVITNIGPSHLEFFRNLPAVFREKKDILSGLKKNGTIILNNDDQFLSRLKGKDFRIITFGIKNKSDFQAANILRERERLSFAVNRKSKFILNTPASHNIYNALAAIACARILGVKDSAIKKTLAIFKFPAARLEIKAGRGIKIIDDTYNANPLSFRSAVEVLAGYNSKHRKIIVCADMKELGKKSFWWHFSLGEYIGHSAVDMLITVGKLARYISLGAKGAGWSAERICQVDSARQACQCLQKILRPADIVLVKGSRSMGMERVVETLCKG